MSTNRRQDTALRSAMDRVAHGLRQCEDVYAIHRTIASEIISLTQVDALFIFEASTEKKHEMLML